MIRRGFWLTAGAVTGIYGYRRVSALGRRVSARLNSAGPAQEAGRAASTGSPRGGASFRSGASPRGVHRGVIGLARETYRFTRDVREGMDLYTARHSRSAGSTLSTDHEATHDATTEATTYEPEDGH